VTRGSPEAYLRRASPFGSFAGGSLFREYDFHDFSGFDVPEYFGEPELMGMNDHYFSVLGVRCIGVRLFRFRLSPGVVRRGASPPFRAAVRELPAVHAGCGT
jgi:hypothetical protein